jgi:glycerol kinase
VLLALDQGSSATKCVAFDHGLRVLAGHAIRVATEYPAAGLVEHDPEELFTSAVAAIDAAARAAGLERGSRATLAIANQTETFVVWERDTLRPVAKAISWQCTRGAARRELLLGEGRADAIKAKTGLNLEQPLFTAPKLADLLDRVDPDRTAARKGELRFGDIGCWLVHRLTGGRVHSCDPGNASRTMLMSIADGDWDPELLSLFDVPPAMLPSIVGSDAVLGPVEPELVGDLDLELAGRAGDQQASLFGQRCWREGDLKLTLGTGAFGWRNSGAGRRAPAATANRSCAWTIAGETVYGDEDVVPLAGNLVEWLVRIGLLAEPAALDHVLAAAGDEADPVVVPPRAGAAARGAAASISGFGIGLDADPDTLSRAAVLGVLDRIVDGIDALAGAGQTSRVRLDGGLSRSRLLPSLLAALAGAPVARSLVSDSSALGVAMLGGIATGLWSQAEVPGEWEGEEATPELFDEETIGRHRERWKEVRDAVDALPAWTS